MKKATLILWVIIFGVIALLIFQNKAFFMVNEALRINLGILEEYKTPALPRAILFLLFFLVGIVIAYLFSLSARLKARRAIKKLNTTLASHNDQVAGLKREIDSLKGIETPEGTDDTQKLASDGLAGDQTVAPGTLSIDSKAGDSTENSEEKST